MANNEDQHSNGALSDFIRIIVLVWSLACLSLSYLGQVKAMDPTFAASMLTAVLSSYGVSVGKNGGKKDDSNKLDAPKTAPSIKS
jgi:hypothetical protein